MAGENKFKILVVPHQYGLKGRIHSLLEGKTIELIHTKEKEASKISKKLLRSCDAVALSIDMESSGLNILLKVLEKDEKRPTKKKRGKKQSKR